ncbi:hypothetical protein DFQ27_008976 [Actinomortierella ambigua]|uniref:Uncharacterized protein n=1 Tax=Actinomortierella ambigua TaxID=1343610 RepID=A0A9P6TY89_9FUNG|nr:hypothetical protein DFQ27_008976 [Actinomortierella ambigua]
MARLYPACIASDDMYLYAISLSSFLGDEVAVLLRSQPYPADLASTEWEQFDSSGFEYSSPWPRVNSCAAVDGTFMVLFETKSEIARPRMRWGFYDTKAAQNDRASSKQVLVHSGTTHCESMGPRCDGRVVGVPGSIPPRFNFFYHQEATNKVKVDIFDRSGVVDTRIPVLDTVTELEKDEGYPTRAHYLLDYMSSGELVIAKIDRLNAPMASSIVNYRVFEVDGQGFPAKGGLKTPGQRVIYSVSETPIRQVAAFPDFGLEQFVPVPAPNRAPPTWAISYVEGGDVYELRLSGPDVGTRFPRNGTHLGYNESLSYVWIFGAVLVANMIVVAGLTWMVKRHRKRALKI